MDTRAVQALLGRSGFPCGAADGIPGPKTKAAVKAFQRAYNGPLPWLAVDGIAGLKTIAALGQLPHLSPHFTVAELASRGGGACYVRRELLAALETLRADLGNPLIVVSAYRDPAHNRRVGGATHSMHLHGLAADLDEPCTVAQAHAVGVFSGIGDRNGRVAHVDLRHLSTHNQTLTATPLRPARWHY